MAALPPGDLNKLKHGDLQKLCKERSLPAKGTKAELIARLTQAGGDEAPAPTSADGDEAAAEPSPTKKQAVDSSTTADASPAKATDSSMEVTTPVASLKKESAPAVAKPAALPAAPTAEIKATEAMAIDQPKEAAEARKAVESDSASKAALAPRPAPRLVPASVNTSGAAIAPAPTETEKPTPAPAPVVRELIVRKRKTAEPVEEVHEVKEIPSSKPASPVLKVTNLVRPFTVPSLKEMLEKHGKILRFWMDPIKTCCVAEYGLVQEASATRNAVHGVVWPPQSGHKKLTVEFATTAELDTLLRPAGAPAPAIQKQKIEAKAVNNKHAAPASSAPAAAAPAAPPKPRGPTLDELFRKTTTKPILYWVPRPITSKPAAPHPASAPAVVPVAASATTAAPTSTSAHPTSNPPAPNAPAPAPAPAPVAAAGETSK